MKILFMLLLVSFNTLSATHRIKMKASLVEFKARGKPAFISIDGKGHMLEGEMSIMNGLISGVIQFDLKSLDTGIELRDEHMKDKYLQVETHSMASLTLKDVKSSDGEFDFNGVMKLHGVERPVSGVAQLTEGKLVASLKLKLSDYEIAIPSFQGITVADEVTVKVNTQLEMIK